MKKPNEALLRFHAELHKTGVISESFRNELSGYAQAIAYEAYEAGRADSQPAPSENEDAAWIRSLASAFPAIEGAGDRERVSCGVNHALQLLDELGLRTVDFDAGTVWVMPYDEFVSWLDRRNG